MNVTSLSDVRGQRAQNEATDGTRDLSVWLSPDCLTPSLSTRDRVIYAVLVYMGGVKRVVHQRRFTDLQRRTGGRWRAARLRESLDRLERHGLIRVVYGRGERISTVAARIEPVAGNYSLRIHPAILDPRWLALPDAPQVVDLILALWSRLDWDDLHGAGMISKRAIAAAVGVTPRTVTTWLAAARRLLNPAPEPLIEQYESVDPATGRTLPSEWLLRWDRAEQAVDAAIASGAAIQAAKRRRQRVLPPPGRPSSGPKPRPGLVEASTDLLVALAQTLGPATTRDDAFAVEILQQEARRLGVREACIRYTASIAQGIRPSPHLPGSGYLAADRHPHSIRHAVERAIGGYDTVNAEYGDAPTIQQFVDGLAAAIDADDVDWWLQTVGSRAPYTPSEAA